MKIEFRQLRCAVALAEHNNFSRAARAVHLSQPAFSRNIQELESRVGKRLFRRGNDGAFLTDEGAIFLRQAKELLLAADKLNEELELVKGSSGALEELHVGAGTYPSDVIFPRALAELLRQKVNVRLQVSSDFWANLLTPLRKGALDFAVMDVTGVDLENDLRITKLAVRQGYIAVRAGHPLLKLKGEELNLEEVQKYPWILPAISSAERLRGLLAESHAGRKNKQQGRPAPEIYLNSISLMKSVVEDSDGWALLGILSMARELKEGRLAALPIILPFYRSNFAVVQSTARKLSATAEKFIRILLQADAELSQEEADLERKYLGIVPRASQPVDISSLKNRRRVAGR